jgi:amidophosphoribosyltransferase
MDKLREECGVIGIFDTRGNECAELAFAGLFALQHRGQESCGIAVSKDGAITCHKELGLVGDVFNKDVISRLRGNVAVGHVRYSTTGESSRENAQPLVTRYVKGTLAIAHNGNLRNANELKKALEEEGGIFQTTTDSEVIAHLIAKNVIHTGAVEDAILEVMKVLKGSYALVVMTPDKLIIARDPLGMRPLCFGKNETAFIAASESCALDTVNAAFIRDVAPGEVIVIDSEGIRSKMFETKDKSRLCIFEYIYFSRSDSVIDGMSVYEARKEAGRILAEEFPAEADMVIGVPDSGIDSAVGFSEQSGIPYGLGLIVNRYVGRTFIKPDQKQRQDSVMIKMNVLKENVKDKRIIMVDDSIVRGTTCARIVKMLKDAGAKEVHMRVSSPPFIWPCYYGTDIPDRDQLTANNYTLEEIRLMIGADSLGYLPVSRLHNIAPKANCGFCDACFTGDHPV